MGAVGYGASATARSMQNLPEELKAPPLAQRTRVLDRHGKPIATFYDENRVNVPLSKVAPIMKRAIIAIEDYRFYQHGALDIKGTLRAFVNNQTAGGGTQGVRERGVCGCKQRAGQGGGHHVRPGQVQHSVRQDIIAHCMHYIDAVQAVTDLSYPCVRVMVSEVYAPRE